ncbi:uncharacterized protein Dsimw501_GD27695 [Drosophila simulans]|uniref:Uncharacterized protein n=1 Tax=Drosophila simulans TaxID=7240 RepID=A0A0J9R662_DROSI|nr:uncharacterized protein Dsimw501_GD27695 [Drosophila simulans]
MRASPKQTAGRPWIAKRRGQLVGLNNPLSTIFSKKQKGYCMDLASLIDSFFKTVSDLEGRVLKISG